MKRFFKFILLFLLCFTIFSISSSVKANSINEIDMYIYVDDSGTAHVTEVWKCSTNQGTEVYHPYFNLGKSEIKDLQVSETESQYTTLDKWDTNGTLKSKAYTCGLNKTSNGVEICWGISQYGQHTYNIRYDITNFVAELEDSQMIYWTLIPKDLSNSVGKAYIKIYTDFSISDDIDVWGFGNYGGTAYVYDGYIEMESNGTLNTSEYMTILVKFPKGSFNISGNKINKDFNNYLQMAQKGAKKYVDNDKSDMIASIISVIVMCLAVIGITRYATKVNQIIEIDNKDKKFSKDLPYYRDIPFNKDLFKAYFIAYVYKLNKNKTDLLGAIILKWIKDGFVRVDIEETGKIIKKEKTAIYLNEVNPEQITNTYENELFDMLYKASKDGILENKEFEKWCKNNYSKILTWFDDVIKKEKEELVNDGLVTVEEKGSILKRKEYKATPELREEAEKIYGLKNYLLDYSLIPERQAIEVKLFEEYFILAQMLGIAKEVAKEFKEIYPELIEQSTYNSYDNIMFINSYSNNAVKAATTAKARAESYSSGGGGFSSGGGGGGSFGGGGGGGGFR